MNEEGSFSWTAEAEALALLARETRLVVVDFDETLYLRNSTEDFLDAAVPGLVAAIGLRALDFLSPWRWTGGAATRDVWRIWAVMLLMPWSLWRWRRVCAVLGPRQANVALLRALRGKDVVIGSIGFAPIINPLLDAMGGAAFRLIACPWPGFTARRGGKAVLLEARLGAGALASAMVITDSLADAELLRRCALPCLTRWKGAQFRRALARIYLPGDYLAYVKRPRVPGVLRLLVTDDLLWWLLVSVTAHAPGLSYLTGIELLFFSFWSVYEIGYWENDVCGLRFEADPVVALEFEDFVATHFERRAWVWAILLGAAGLAALGPEMLFQAGPKWLGFLLLLRLLYYLYNRIDKPTRIWLYLPLQCCRSLALAAVVPLGVVGILAGLAQILARWQGYAAYRRTKGATWRDTPARAVQLAILLAGLSFMALARPQLAIAGWPALELLIWSGFLARREVSAILRGARWKGG